MRKAFAIFASGASVFALGFGMLSAGWHPDVGIAMMAVSSIYLLYELLSTQCLREQIPAMLRFLFGVLVWCAMAALCWPSIAKRLNPPPPAVILAPIQPPTPATQPSPTRKPAPGSDGTSNLAAYRPVLSVVESTSITWHEEGDRLRFKIVVILTNSSNYETTAKIKAFTSWDGVPLRLYKPGQEERVEFFAPHQPYTMTADPWLDSVAAQRFRDGTGILSLQFTASYPDRSGTSTYTFKGTAVPTSASPNQLDVFSSTEYKPKQQ